MTPAARAALAYAKRLGWRVLPVHAVSAGCSCSCGRACHSPGKHPIARAWQEDATSDPERIRALWDRWPFAGVGIEAGSIGWVLDVDAKAGGDDTLRDLEARHGAIPTTPRQLTGGGGVHYLFSRAAGVRNAVGAAPGLDVRAAGGFIVAAPSLHASGRRYAWDADAHPLEVRLSPAPGWLLEMVRQNRPGTPCARPPEEWVRLAGEVVGEGARNATLARLAGHLLRKDVDGYVALALLEGWNVTRCRPPLEPDEVRRTVESVAKKEAERRAEA